MKKATAKKKQSDQVKAVKKPAKKVADSSYSNYDKKKKRFVDTDA